MRFVWLGVKIPSAMTDVSMVQFTTTMAYMTTWSKQTSTILAQKSVAVLWHCNRSKDKIPRALKRFVCKLLQFLLRRRLSAELVLCSTLNLFDLQIFFITIPQEARKGKSWGGTSMRASKRTLWVFTDCKLMKNRGTKCTFILVVVRPTVEQNSFHTEFLSSIRFSPLRLLRRRKRTRNFLTFSSGLKEELKLSLPTTKANWR